MKSAACAQERKNVLLKDGNKSDRIDARGLAELLHGNDLKAVDHGDRCADAAEVS
jgi:hypothetical protein